MDTIHDGPRLAATCGFCGTRDEHTEECIDARDAGAARGRLQWLAARELAIAEGKDPDDLLRAYPEGRTFDRAAPLSPDWRCKCLHPNHVADRYDGHHPSHSQGAIVAVLSTTAGQPQPICEGCRNDEIISELVARALDLRADFNMADAEALTAEVRELPQALRNEYRERIQKAQR